MGWRFDGSRRKTRGSAAAQGFIAALVFLDLFFASAAQAQQPANLERGFSPDKVFQFGDLDSVSLLNGNLNIEVPLGTAYPVGPALSYQFSLVYNSKAWEAEPYAEVYRKSLPAPLSNAGMGWRISLGQLFDNQDALAEPKGVVYVSPDGAEHTFYSSLHAGGAPDTVCLILPCHYTRDSSYLRLQESSESVRHLHFPDGTTHRFEKWTYPNDSSKYEWRLAAINDRFANPLPGDDIQIDYTGFPDDATWTITDRIGRTQTLTFEHDPAFPGDATRRRLTSVSLTTFNGTTADYSFSYRNGATATTVDVPCGPPAPVSATASVSLLSTITLPDDSGFGMTYPTTQAAASVCFAPALITKMTLPTSGSINWTYSARALPLGECTSRHGSWHSVTASLATRTFKSSTGTDLAKWAYVGFLSARPTSPSTYICDESNNTTPQSKNHEEELTVRVDTPGGDREFYYFSVYPDPPAPGGEIPYSGLFSKEDYGLPFTRKVTDKSSTDTSPTLPRYLSKEVFDCTNGANCTLLRQTYVRFESDPPASCLSKSADPEKCMNTNRRLAASRTVYRDDPKKTCVWPPSTTGIACRSVTEDLTDFDGFGHFRQQTTSSTFGPPAAKVLTTQYTPDQNFWLLETFSERKREQGSSVEAQIYTFDPVTGFLDCVRKRANASVDGNKDVLVSYQPDEFGYPAMEKWFGGEDNNVSLTGCNPSNAVAWYTYNHTNTPGVVATNTPGTRKTTVQVDGTTLALTDIDIDPNTGLARASRDVAGLATSFVYDWRGFLTRQQRTGQEPVINALCLPGATTGSECAEATSRPQLLSRVGEITVLEQERWTFDGIGRVKLQERKRPGTPDWDAKQVLYDSAGRKSFESEWGKGPPYGTSFSEYDPFGRARYVTLADQTFTTLIYAGVSSLSRETHVWDGKAPKSAKTIEFYDHEGRLSVTQEPNGTRTRYNYDVAGRLKSVAQNVGGSTVQKRQFFYDGRGFLYQETHPENGNTFYRRDVKGNPTKITRADGSRVVYTYDAAGRLRQVRSPNNVVLRDYVYGTSGTSTGKLAEEWAYNWRPAGTPAVCTNFKIGETYTYNSPSGFIDQKTTSLFQGTVAQESFRQSYTYDGAGRIKTLTYPDCVSSAPSPSPVCATGPRPVTTNYSNGRPTSISGFASNITYHTNGMVASVVHTNQVADYIAVDPDTGMQRPQSIAATRISDGASVWAPQSYTYDPAGNITAIGTNKYAYDTLSRLVSATVPGITPYPYRKYDYDVFGNVTRVTEGTLDSFNNPVLGPSVDYTPVPSTNRLSGAGYNDRGNLTGYQGSSYTWERLDNLASVNTGSEIWTHTYDANNERIWSWRTSPSRVDTYALRDLGGRLLRDYKKEGSLFTKEDYIYREGQPLATVNASGETRHFHLDHLGSVRRITNLSGGVVGMHDMWPYGEEYTSGSDSQQMRFTGHERDLGVLSDPVDDLDYMHARHYRPLLGRFLSVDSHPGKVKVPASWNRYAYTRGNPVKYIDPDGEDVLLVVRNNSGGGTFNFGHVALRVFGKGYDFTYDFGRYAPTGYVGRLRSTGPGILRVWSDFSKFVAGQLGSGDLKGGLYKTTLEQDKAVMGFFEEKVRGGKATDTKSPDFSEYRLAQDYNLISHNCTTICIDALESAENQTGIQFDNLDDFSADYKPLDLYREMQDIFGENYRSIEDLLHGLKR